MAWDDDKQTASDPDNPSASEQLTATEWDNHVSDQISRLEYGLLSNRPAASNKPEGALWLDEHGRISRADSNGNWVLDSFGSSSNPIPGTSHFNAVSTESLVTEQHYAGAFDGTDADARLDNALSKATAGDRIFLEQAAYETDRTISTKIDFVGVALGVSPSIATRINGVWTCSARINIRDVSGSNSSGQIIFDTDRSKLIGGLFTPPIQINAGSCLITNVSDGDVTFAAGTGGGLVDSCINTTVTDNGSNTVGDVV